MKYLLYATCLTLTFLTGCVIGPKERIEQQSERFNRYSAQEKYLIRQGQIEVGFDQEQVRLAWGEPQRSRQETSAKGTLLVWEYTVLQPNYNAYSNASIKRGFDAGVQARGSPTRKKLRRRVFFDPQTGKVARFQTFF